MTQGISGPYDGPDRDRDPWEPRPWESRPLGHRPSHETTEPESEEYDRRMRRQRRLLQAAHAPEEDA